MQCQARSGLPRSDGSSSIRRRRTPRSSSSSTETTWTTSSSAPSLAAATFRLRIPVQAADHADLREKLRVDDVVLTTIQKFMPAEMGDRNAVLSDRRNIVVIADEAHRGQYDRIRIYEVRPTKLELSEAERPKIDPAFEEVTEGEEVEGITASKASRRSWTPSLVQRSGCGSSPPTWSTLSRSGSKPLT